MGVQESQIGETKRLLLLQPTGLPKLDLRVPRKTHPLAGVGTVPTPSGESDPTYRRGSVDRPPGPSPLVVWGRTGSVPAHESSGIGDEGTDGITWAGEEDVDGVTEAGPDPTVLDVSTPSTALLPPLREESGLGPHVFPGVPVLGPTPVSGRPYRLRTPKTTVGPPGLRYRGGPRKNDTLDVYLLRVHSPPLPVGVSVYPPMCTSGVRLGLVRSLREGCES